MESEQQGVLTAGRDDGSVSNDDNFLLELLLEFVDDEASDLLEGSE